MPHVFWHTCLTVGESAGEIPINLKAGKRGAGTAAFAMPHGLTKEQEAALKKAADAKFMELVNLFRESQESIVFHPVPDPPGE
jgi:hypothetical protein